jgi:hypothetical protein
MDPYDSGISVMKLSSFMSLYTDLSMCGSLHFPLPLACRETGSQTFAYALQASTPN